jgi:molybdopterin synthase catalytic subunit
MPSASSPAAIISGRVASARITGEPLSAELCIDAVKDPAAGGLGVFLGVVRDTDDGRPVESLHYEAHPSATGELDRVCAAIAGEYDVVAVAAEHRIDTLVIGDLAVVVAVSARHRAEALTATHALIDRIKSEVPIWKHQRFADGTEEWVGCA